MTIRPIKPSKTAEREHLAALRAMLQDAIVAIERGIVPDVERAAEAMQAKAFHDGGLGFAGLRTLIASLAWTATRVVTRVLETEAGRHTEAWKDRVRAALGIDIGAMIDRSDLADLMALRAQQNASLISSLGEDLVSRVERACLDAIRNGTTGAALRKTLRDQYGIVDRRAKIIARDQIGSLTADLNQARQTQAGVETYVWRTSEDERVRTAHVALNGRAFRWDQPGPDAGQHPGQPIQCRCTAEAVIEIED